MAKNDNAAPVTAASLEAVAAPAAPLLTLDEFCARLSKTVRRPELIGAFHHSEQKAGNAKDAEAAYRARFDKFSTTPV